MSYSRFSNSVWYTYPLSSDARVADDEEFCIAYVKDFTYYQLRVDMVGCIQYLWERCSWASIDQLRELAYYIYFFMAEVEFKHSVGQKIAEDFHDVAKKELDEIESLYRDELPYNIIRDKSTGRKRN